MTNPFPNRKSAFGPQWDTTHHCLLHFSILLTKSLHQDNTGWILIMTEAAQCAGCTKTALNLKRCAKCQTTLYCSRECQKADWKQHKRVCSSNPASANFSPSTSTDAGQPPKGLSVAIDKPFHRLDAQT